MKIKVWCDSGANIHSCREGEIDLENDWGITDEEWGKMSDNEKNEAVTDWAYENLEIGWSKVEEN